MKDHGALYERLFDLSERLMRGCRESADRWNVPVSIQGLGPGFSVLFTTHGHLWDYRDLVRYHDAGLATRFTQALAERGVLCSGATWFVSAAHTAADIELTFAAVDDAMKEVSGT